MHSILVGTSAAGVRAEELLAGDADATCALLLALVVHYDVLRRRDLPHARSAEWSPSDLVLRWVRSLSPNPPLCRVRSYRRQTERGEKRDTRKMIERRQTERRQTETDRQKRIRDCRLWQYYEKAARIRDCRFERRGALFCPTRLFSRRLTTQYHRSMTSHGSGAAGRRFTRSSAILWDGHCPNALHSRSALRRVKDSCRQRANNLKYENKKERGFKLLCLFASTYQPLSTN